MKISERKFLKRPAKDNISPSLIVLCAGLYPFFHYYSSNISEATSWQQFVFLFGLCFLLPQILLFLIPLLLKINFFKSLKPFSVSILNSTVFIGLLGFLAFYHNKKTLLLVLVLAFGVGFFIAKHIKKVVVIQLLFAVMGFVSLIPKLVFHFNQNNTWAKLSIEELQTELKNKPNIFVIQPDGYVNFSEIDKPPYDYDNSEFKSWLSSEGFTNYQGFRSNYYSTYTSNSSMFAMKHHYYSNTNKSTLKTHKPNEAIVGKYNNVLSILKHNGYKSYLITDNSFFLIDRQPLSYDYCNIDTKWMSYHNSGSVTGADIKVDLSRALDTLTSKQNFIFIEKTLPSHIIYKESLSKGKNSERTNYLQRLEDANEWIKSLINEINVFDKNALVIVVADHGGFVGLDYTLQASNNKLNKTEALSVFSSLLSIKWPKSINLDNATNYTSNVNLFRNLFYALSKNKSLLDNLEGNESFLPLKNGEYNGYYKYFDNDGNYVFELISE